MTGDSENEVVIGKSEKVTFQMLTEEKKIAI